MINKIKKIPGIKYILIILIIFIIITILAFFKSTQPDFEGQQFPKLAWEFIHGRTYYPDDYKSVDLVIRNGHKYWPLAPMPTLLLLPSTFIGQRVVSQYWACQIVVAGVFFLIFALVNIRFKFKVSDSIWLTVAYLFGSIFAVSTYIPWPWYYTHAIATFFLFASFWEFFGRKRYWLIGIYLGCTFMTRFTAGLTVIFFLLVILSEHVNWKNTLKNLFLLGLPIFFAGMLLLSYNYIRFNNPFDNGYTTANSDEDRWLTNKYGLFNPIYIPTNIFHYFLASFQPVYDESKPAHPPTYFLKPPYFRTTNMYSVGFFMASPIFALVLLANKKKKYVKFALVNAAIILLIILNFHYHGGPQIGPRYMNDLLPLLFICLLYYFKEKPLELRHKTVIVISIIINFWVAMTTFLM